MGRGYQNREVVKIDTRTCEVVDTHPSYGFSPSRTAVTLTGSVWVGNRGIHGGNGADPAHEMLLISMLMAAICRAPVTSGASSGGVAVQRGCHRSGGERVAWKLVTA